MAQSKIAPNESAAINPTTGEVLTRYPHQTPDEVQSLLDQSVAAFRIWRDVEPVERAAIIGNLAGILRRRIDAFAIAMTREMGKPITQARAEIEKCAALCEWAAASGAPLLDDEPTEIEGQAAYVSYLPLGPILGIMPWNFPFWQAMRGIVPVVLAGNSFILKHAPNCLATAYNVASAFEEAGVPKGLISVLNVAQDDIEAIIGDDRVAAVSLTGSVRAGSAVASQAGRAIKKSLLELGGSDPFIVLADADLDRAVPAAVLARFQNSGQICIAAKRIIVEEPVVEEFSRRFVAAVKDLKIGDPEDESTYIGPMARVDLRSELADQVKRTVEQGAQVLLEGGPQDGADGTAFFKPVVLSGVEPGMAAFEEETFGPVAAIITAKDAEDAIRLANQSEFGLSGAIWTADVAKARQYARRIESGGVFINGFAASDPRTPIGGVKKSGYGRELSHFGVREFTNAQIVWIDRR
ncbi:NAD-dependent succinate-semialdehyde dehydrogenase [Sphingobium vermicomposti]|uniref:Succinate-semialdehyde dehydrogenase n=1 Tax=Sphingobium vermicomposti TaxID=529005 RepID=A0A846MBA1_9SPHN|nr:NAD-dependent succinate-semialdehyde dehydrogenase [Sphingobium vermicomposti]NIJ17910.1 succinate-semialdehyde dehydrogenase [Sphingobium vermicomposti]